MSELHLGAGSIDRHAAHGPCHLSFGTRAGLRQVTMGNGAVRAEILVDKGANVRQFWHAPTGARALAESADWCEQLEKFHRGGCRGGSYSDCYEGGWQDVLPARARWAGGGIGNDGDGDGSGIGEAAILPWEVTRWVCTPAAARLVCRCRLARSGLEVVKRFIVRAGGPALRVDTAVRNAAARDVWFSWTQHPALGGDLLDETSRVLLPGGHLRASRDQNHVSRDGDGRGGGGGSDDGDGRAGWHAPRWVGADSLLPATGAADAFATFADVGRGDAALASRGRGIGVRLRWSTAALPHVWLWCARRDGITCVAIEPSNTYLPEMLPRPESELLRLLRPGESIRTWAKLSIFPLGSASGRDVAGDEL